MFRASMYSILRWWRFCNDRLRQSLYSIFVPMSSKYIMPLAPSPLCLRWLASYRWSYLCSLDYMIVVWDPIQWSADQERLFSRHQLHHFQRSGLVGSTQLPTSSPMLSFWAWSSQSSRISEGLLATYSTHCYNLLQADVPFIFHAVAVSRMGGCPVIAARIRRLTRSISSIAFFLDECGKQKPEPNESTNWYDLAKLDGTLALSILNERHNHQMITGVEAC